MPAPAIIAALARLGPMLARVGSGAAGAAGESGGIGKLLQSFGSAPMDTRGFMDKFSYGSKAPEASDAGKMLGNIGNLVSGLGNVGELGKNVFSQQSPFGATGAGIRGLGEMGGEGTKAITGFVAGLVEGVDKLRDFGKHLHDSNMQFAQFSGSMAQVQAQTMAQEIMLSRGKGEARAGTAGQLASSRMRLEGTVAPIENAWANLQNTILSKILDGLNMVITPLSQLVQWLTTPTEGTGGVTWGGITGMADLKAEVEAARPRKMQ